MILLLPFDSLPPAFLDLEAEVHYASQHEYAQTAIDFIARRSRLSFLNAGAALDVLPRVIQLMGDDLNWSTARRREEWVKAREFLVSMGLPPSADVQEELAAVKGKLGDAGPVRNWARWWLSPWHWAKTISSVATAPLAPAAPRHSRGLFSVEDLERVKRAFANADTTISRDDVGVLMREMDFGIEGVEPLIDDALKALGVRNGDRIGFEQFWQVSLTGSTFFLDVQLTAVVPSRSVSNSRPLLWLPASKRPSRDQETGYLLPNQEEVYDVVPVIVHKRHPRNKCPDNPNVWSLTLYQNATQVKDDQCLARLRVFQLPTITYTDMFREFPCIQHSYFICLLHTLKPPPRLQGSTTNQSSNPSLTRPG